MEVEITEARKQLGKCPECGDPNTRLKYLLEWNMCSYCKLKSVRRNVEKIIQELQEQVDYSPSGAMAHVINIPLIAKLQEAIK